jgi:hypothetical protein
MKRKYFLGYGVCGASSQAKRRSLFAGFAVLLIAAIFTLAGCDIGTGGDGHKETETETETDGYKETDTRRAFSVSGSFTKSGTSNDGTVNFNLKSDKAQSSANSVSRAVATADSYTLSGVLEDGDIKIRLKGSYDPNTGNWTVSANSSFIIYTLNGSVNSVGVSQGSSATIAVYNEGTEEWVPYFFPVTEESVSVPAWTEASDGVTGGVPSFMQGYWHSNHSYGGYTDSISILVSDWKVAVSGTTTSPYGNRPIDQNWTLLEIDDKTGGVYEIIGCYPYYVETSDDLADAAEEYLGLSNGAITAAASNPFGGGSPPDGRWVYYTASGGYSYWGGFSSAEYDKLDVFWGTGGWEKWAADNSVTKANKYIAAKITYSGNSFGMINLVGIANASQPWDQTYDFPTLADLKAATLVEERNWEWNYPELEDTGVAVRTFTR